MQHRARKRFGQNFLVDEDVIERLVAAIAPVEGQRMIEIGPGLGALTAPLLERSVDLHVIELDRDLAATLPDRLGQPAHLTVHAADALKFDFSTLATTAPVRVVGNLPYNISTPLLFALLEQSDVIADMHFMLQREVVERLAATAGTRDRGRLTLMCEARSTVTPLFTISPDAFQPAPKVESAFVRIVPKTLTSNQLKLLPALETVVREAFRSKRKTLRNNLRGRISAEQLEQLGIDPGRRAETLTLDEFLRIAEFEASTVDGAGQ